MNHQNESVSVKNCLEFLKNDLSCSEVVLLNGSQDNDNDNNNDNDYYSYYRRKRSVIPLLSSTNNLNEGAADKRIRRRSLFSSPSNSEIDCLNLYGTYMDYKFDHHEPKQQQSAQKLHRFSLNIVCEKENSAAPTSEKVRRKSWHERLYEKKRKKSLGVSLDFSLDNDNGFLSDHEQSPKAQKFKQKRHSWWQLFILSSRSRRASFDSVKIRDNSVDLIRTKSRSVDQGFPALAHSPHKNAEDGKEFQKKPDLPETKNYTVTGNDTLTSIAAGFDITPSELKKLNRLTTTFIFPGQQLKVPIRQPDNDAVDGGVMKGMCHKLERATSINSPANNSDVDEVIFHQDSPSRKDTFKDQFLKLNAKHITDGHGFVNGVILVTPNAVIFDPNVSDPLVIENGQETYGVVAPMEYVVNIAIFYDHFTSQNSDNAIYYPNVDVNESPSDNFPELAVSAGSSISVSNAEPSQRNEGNAFPKAFDSDLVTPLNEDVLENEPEIMSTAIHQSDELPSSVLESKTSVEHNIITDLSEPKPAAVSFNLDAIDADSKSKMANAELGNKDNKRNKMFKRFSHPLNWMETFTSNTDSRDDDKSLPSGSSSADSNHSGSVFTKFFPSSSINLVDFGSGIFKTPSEEFAGYFYLSDNSLADPNYSPSLFSPQSLINTVTGRHSTNSPQKQPAVSSFPKSEKSSGSIIPKVDYLPGLSAKDMPGLFLAFDKLVSKPTKSDDDNPLFLRLVMGKPVDKPISRTTSVMSYGRQEIHSHYWWSIPRNKVDDLYHFVQSLDCAHLYGKLDEEEIRLKGYELIEDKVLIEPKKSIEIDTDVEGIEMSDLADVTKDNWEKIKAPYVKILSMLKSTSLQSADYKDMEENQQLYRVSSKVTLDSEILPPDLLGTTDILKCDYVDKLSRNLPARCIGYSWSLVFSTNEHGFSLNSLYRKMLKIESPILMAIEDTYGNVFGALTSRSFRLSEHFYGTGESFLFRLHPEFEVFRWTGKNQYFIRTDTENLTIGSGDGKFGIWLDSDLYHGRSERCLTYNNDPLSSECDFFVKTLECWSFL